MSQAGLFDIPAPPIGEAGSTCCGAAIENRIGDCAPPHYGKVICSACGSFVRWLANPDAIGNRRPNSHRGLAKKYGAGRCVLCRVPETSLRGECLEAHHLQPYADGGSDDRENILVVCTTCHTLVEWLKTARRRYVGAVA